jgi:hypothetical protein
MLHYNNKALGYIDTLDRIVTLDNGLLWVLSFHHITLYQYGDMTFRKSITKHDNCSIFVDENYIAKAVGNQVQVRNHDKIFKGSVKATVIKSMKLNTIPYINARISMIDIDFMGD